MKSTLNDLHMLQEIGYETFNATYHGFFQHPDTIENMQSYLKSAFSLEQLRTELLNVSLAFYFLYWNKELAGYLKVNVNDAQTDHVRVNALEIERLYIRTLFQGQGLGKSLIKKGVQIATELNKKQVWLSAWEKNTGAIQFYKKWGLLKMEPVPFIWDQKNKLTLLW